MSSDQENVKRYNATADPNWKLKSASQVTAEFLSTATRDQLETLVRHLNERSTKAAILTYQWVGGKR